MPDIQIARVDDNPHATHFGIREDTSTRGVDLAGALITAVYSDGTHEALTWQAFDPYTYGGAIGGHINMAFGFELHELTATKRLASLTMDIAPANSVYDTTTAMDDDPEGGSTATSKNGFYFKVGDDFADLEGSIAVTYSGVVALAGRLPEGDLYTTMTIDFSGLADGGLLGELRWDTDMDTMAVAGDLTLATAAMVGGPNGDSLTGTGMADTIFGQEGNDTIHGLAGVDTAGYQLTQQHYTLRLGADIEVIDRTGLDGTDALEGIEVLSFEGSRFELSRFDDVSNLTAAAFSEFAEMYIAYFNRAPDAAGLMFWANAFATGTSMEEVAGLFASSDEALALYPADAAATDFVEAIYVNVLGRVSDAVGASFWTGVLDNGSVSRSEFVLAVLRGARAEAPDDATPEFIAQQMADVAYLDGKIDVGIYYSAVLGMSDVDNARAVMAHYDGSAESVMAAQNAADIDFASAVASDGSGEFLIQLVGVVEDPFAEA